MGRSNYNRSNYVVNNTDNRRYNEHDDRGSAPRIRDRLGPKQVGFVDGPRGGGIRKKGHHQNNRDQKLYNALLLDDDVDLDGGNNEHRYSSERGGGGRGSFRGRGGRKNWRGMQRPGGPGRTPPGIVVGNRASAFSWSKITLRNGNKYDKRFLLRELVNRAKVKFVPICYVTQANNSVFYVDDHEAARAIKDLDKQIELPDGYKLIINLERTTAPNVPLSDDIIEKLKKVLEERYFRPTSALNLKSLHNDDSFAGEPFYVPLWRTNFLVKVLTLITDYVPDVKAIDLSDNKLMSLDGIVQVKSKLPHLNILYVANNKITDLKSLENLSSLNLTELILTGNPVIDRLGSSYTSSIRKIFPKLKVLDGKDLPVEISFDEGNSNVKEIPPTVVKFIKNEAAGNLVLQFLEQYFLLYDSDSRQPLLDAYHEHAVMSMSTVGSFEVMKPYIEESRNLLRVTYEGKRHKLLHKGRLAIVSFLTGLPKTEHDPTSFTLDLPFTSDRLMVFTVTGLFRDKDTKNKSIRHFSRCFIVVPQGSGFCIVNETLFIEAPTSKDLKSFNAPQKQMGAAAAAAAASPVAAAPVLNIAAKQSLALSFSQMSGMNMEWSGKCLEENLWDFDKSAKVFNDLKLANKIPPEAFIKP